MKAAIKNKWAAALESGEFRQGRLYLRRADDLFCCLGVLCELYRQETGDGQWHMDDDEEGYTFNCGGGAEEQAALPGPVVRWAGLVSKNPMLGDDVLAGYAASLNDDGAPFDEIARLVRQLPSE